MRNLVLSAILIVLATGCTVSKHYNPAKKFGPDALQADYALFRAMLEESHPGLYWYTPKDSMDYYFNAGAQKLLDSMTEYKFRNVLSYVASKIRCGHTSIRPSKAAVAYAERTRSFALPLAVKAWPDTVVVTANLNRNDKNIVRGVVLQSIEGRPIQSVVDSMFSHLSGDGYNTTHKYQVLSNGGTFRSLYGALYGLRPKMDVTYLDSAGVLHEDTLVVYNPAADTPRVRPERPVHRPSRKERRAAFLRAARSLRMDTAAGIAYMDVNSFTRDVQLRSFFKKSFREIKKAGIEHLVIDLRGNGGGSVVLSNLLTKYIADKPFKIADSIYALKKRSSYGKHIEQYLQNRLFMIFMSRKKKDGMHHFSYYEGKYFKPRKKNHYNGKVYVLTGGNTFSAATLFAKTVKPQENVVIVGEETGGGAYGNTAWLIPDAVLPRTGVRFRLPLFRLVIDRDEPKGRGIMPEVESAPTLQHIMEGGDFKLKKVQELIRADRQKLAGDGS